MRVLAIKCVDGIVATRTLPLLRECDDFDCGGFEPYIGYAAAAEIAKESIKTGRTVTEIALERKLIDEKTAEILDPLRMTEPAPPLEKAHKKASKKVVS